MKESQVLNVSSAKINQTLLYSVKTIIHINKLFNIYFLPKDQNCFGFLLNIGVVSNETNTDVRMYNLFIR